MNPICEFLKNNWLDLFLVIVGTFALVVYFLQKRDERRTAATLIKEQIDLIEDRVNGLKDSPEYNNIVVYYSKIILQENLWEKYKYLLVKKLYKSDVKSIQKFFDNAEQIEYARRDIIQAMNNTWEHKSLVGNQGVAEYIQTELAGLEIKSGETIVHPIDMNKANSFMNFYSSLDSVFVADPVVNKFIKYLGEFRMLSGSATYEKIQRLSYEK